MTETFHIVPAGARPLWVVVPVVLLLLGVGVFLGLAAYGSRYARFEVSPAGLRLRGDIYGRLIPGAALQAGAATIVNLWADSAYRPRRRTLGTGLPGYWAGWFRLRSGEKALLFVTDPAHVVYVPTNLGYSVLLSVTQPAALLKALRAIAPGS